jgi:hypothetical protein
VRTPLLAAIFLIAAGCAAPGISPTAAAPTPSPPPSPSASAAPSPSEATPGAEPPNALLTVDGRAPIAGALGTYTWFGTGSDAPWLRGTPVKLPPGGAATVSLEPPAALAAWSVSEAQPGGDETTAREIATGSGPIAFSVPNEAATIVLRLEFAANAGDASYFWALSPG